MVALEGNVLASHRTSSMSRGWPTPPKVSPSGASSRRKGPSSFRLSAAISEAACPRAGLRPGADGLDRTTLGRAVDALGSGDSRWPCDAQGKGVVVPRELLGARLSTGGARAHARSARASAPAEGEPHPRA